MPSKGNHIGLRGREVFTLIKKFAQCSTSILQNILTSACHLTETYCSNLSLRLKQICPARYDVLQQESCRIGEVDQCIDDQATSPRKLVNEEMKGGNK